jgi:hypothetical protein
MEAVEVSGTDVAAMVVAAVIPAPATTGTLVERAPPTGAAAAIKEVAAAVAGAAVVDTAFELTAFVNEEPRRLDVGPIAATAIGTAAAPTVTIGATTPTPAFAVVAVVTRAARPAFAPPTAAADASVESAWAPSATSPAAAGKAAVAATDGGVAVERSEPERVFEAISTVGKAAAAASPPVDTAFDASTATGVVCAATAETAAGTLVCKAPAVDATL